MYYSKTVGGFIPDEWMEDGTYNPIPSDAIKLTEKEIDEFHGVSIPGKMVDVSNGRLLWVDLPPPTRDELIATAEQERQKLLAHADAVILDWRTELMLGEISDANRGKLSAWLAYKNEVKTWDVKTDPEHVNWPVPPEA